jgi:hypothetical protein
MNLANVRMIPLTSLEIQRRVRAFYFSEYQMAQFDGKAVKQICILGQHEGSPEEEISKTHIHGVYVVGDNIAIEMLWR